MRIIGLDLALNGAHKALLADERGQPLAPVLSLQTTARDLQQLLDRAREPASDEEVVLVMEPTGMAWFPVAAFALRQPHVTVYLVNSQQVADLRRYYQKHHKSDRIDARVLAKLPVVSPEKLHPLCLPSAERLACQRGCKELDRRLTLRTAIQNRLQAVDRFAWPGLEAVLPGTLSPQRCWFREQWYDPQAVRQAGAARLCQAWSRNQEEDAKTSPASDWAQSLVALAEQVLALFGEGSPFLDYGYLQAEVTRDQALLDFVAEQHQALQIETVRPLYRQLHTHRHLETLKGVGQDGAAVYASFIGSPDRFADLSHFRSWSGMIPNSQQSGESEAQGLRITQAGPDLVKKFAYLDAEVARQHDPQLAALYYDQMVHHGKHHCQAVCACATHLLDRIWVVLSEDRPYELRDVDGQPVTVEEAQRIIAERYRVPAEVRQRNNRRHRRAQAEAQAEKRNVRTSGKQKREKRPSR
jgi:transposase